MMKEIMPVTISNQIALSDGSSVENTDEALKAHHESVRISKAKGYAEYNRQKEENRTGKLCPVDALYSVHECKKDCALYLDGCRMKHKQPEKDTADLPCPFMRKCNDQCALYEKGCTL